DPFDEGDEVGSAVSEAGGLGDEFAGPLVQDGVDVGGVADADAAAAAEFQDAFVAEFAEGAEGGVGVDVELGGDLLGGGHSFAGGEVALGDGAPDAAGELLVQRGRVGDVQVKQHDAIYSSTIFRQAAELGGDRPGKGEARRPWRAQRVACVYRLGCRSQAGTLWVRRAFALAGRAGQGAALDAVGHPAEDAGGR